MKQYFKFSMLLFAVITAFVSGCNQPQTKTDNVKQDWKKVYPFNK